MTIIRKPLPAAALDAAAKRLKLSEADYQVAMSVLVMGQTRAETALLMGVSRQYVDKRVNRVLKLAGIDLKAGTVALLVDVPFDIYTQAASRIPNLLAELTRLGVPTIPQQPVMRPPNTPLAPSLVTAPAYDPDSFNLPPEAIRANQRALEERIRLEDLAFEQAQRGPEDDGLSAVFGDDFLD